MLLEGRSDEHKKLVGVDRGESYSCKDSTGRPVGAGETKIALRIPKVCCQQLGRTNDFESMDIPDESEKLISTTVDLDGQGIGEIPRMYPGGTKMRVGEIESHGSRTDGLNGDVKESRSHTDGPWSQTDASTVLNTRETVSVGDGDDTGTKKGAENARRGGAWTDGLANQTDASRGTYTYQALQTARIWLQLSSRPLVQNRKTA